MKGEFKTQESAFYCFYYNLDPDDLTKQERDNCIRQGCQLNKQLIAGKDTTTIKFYKYWCQNNIYDFKNKSVVKNNTSNNGDVKIDKDGVLVQSVKELKVWNKQEECYDDYNEARVITILKILEDKAFVSISKKGPYHEVRIVSGEKSQISFDLEKTEKFISKYDSFKKNVSFAEEELVEVTGYVVSNETSSSVDNARIFLTVSELNSSHVQSTILALLHHQISHVHEKVCS